MDVKSLKSSLILFFKTVLFSGIHADLLYRYHFSVLCYATVNIYYANRLTCFHLIC